MSKPHARGLLAATLVVAFAATDPDDDASAIKALKDWAKRMKDVGTPAGIPADAKRGAGTQRFKPCVRPWVPDRLCGRPG